MVRFDCGPLLEGQIRIAKLESAYSSLIIGILEVYNVKPTNRKLWAWILLMWSDLTVGPLLQGQMRIAKLKSAYNSLIDHRGLGCESNL